MWSSSRSDFSVVRSPVVYIRVSAQPRFPTAGDVSFVPASVFNLKKKTISMFTLRVSSRSDANTRNIIYLYIITKANSNVSYLELFRSWRRRWREQWIRLPRSVLAFVLNEFKSQIIKISSMQFARLIFRLVVVYCVHACAVQQFGLKRLFVVWSKQLAIRWDEQDSSARNKRGGWLANQRQKCYQNGSSYTSYCCTKFKWHVIGCETAKRQRPLT